MWLWVAVLPAAGIPAPPAGPVPAPVPPAPTSYAALGTAQASGAAPARLILAAVSLNAAVVPVELGADGRLGVPEDGRSAGWWKDTAPPGSRRGTTVIAGHVDTRRGAAVFAPLVRARTGDLAQVTTAAATFDYRVRAVTVRRGDALPTELFRTGGPPRLVLITCTGPYQPGSGYRDRLYIDAAPV
nr:MULTISPECIES: class F sortase [Streptomyces]